MAITVLEPVRKLGIVFKAKPAIGITPRIKVCRSPLLCNARYDALHCIVQVLEHAKKDALEKGVSGNLVVGE